MFSILDQARENAEQQLAQTILEHKQALAELTSRSPKSETLNHHHNWADKLHAAILNYACAANMSIVARILKLPRELRDEIYKHLWAFDEDQDPNRALLYWWDSFDEPWFQKDEDVSKSPWLTTPTMGLRPPHFVDKAFVGLEGAREVLECFKDVIGKDLRPAGEKYPVGECGLLDVSMQDFVQKDVFGVGMTMEELTRNLDLRVSFQCDALVENDALEEFQKTTTNAEDSRENIQKEYLCELDDGATAFLDIPVTDRVIIRDEHSQHLKVRPRIVTLAIRQESDFRGSVFLDILALVSRVCKGLRTKGFAVKIQYYSEAIALKVLFKDDAWEWAGADWRPNMTRNNMFEEHVRARGSGTRAYVWAQLKEYLFCDSSDTASSRNSQM